MNKLKNTFKASEKSTIALFAIAMSIIIIMGVLEPKTFLSVKNFQGMAIQFPEMGILAFGMMLAMIAGGIDLSLVGIANFSSIVCATIMVFMGGTPLSIVVGILAAIATGALCGTLNGFLIGYFQIPAMLVTLATLQLYTGMGLVITKGPAVNGLPEAFGKIASNTFLGLPLPFIIFIAVAIMVSFILKSTIYGRQIYFMGTNSTASKYSGINNLKVTILTYLTSGVLGSIGGIVISSHYNSAKSDYGSSYTLLTLLIVVLGGVNPDGGKGKVLGVATSVIVLQLVSSAFNILRVNAFIKTFAWGIILIAIMVGMYLSNKKKRA